MKRRGFRLTIGLVVASIVATAGLFGCGPAAHRRPAVKLPKPPSEKWMLATVVDCRGKQVQDVLRDLRKKFPKQAILRRPTYLSAGRNANLWFVTHNFKLPPDSRAWGRTKNGIESYSLAQYYVNDDKSEVALYQQLLTMDDQDKLRLGPARVVRRDELARPWGRISLAVTKYAVKRGGPARYGVTALAHVPDKPDDRIIHLNTGPCKSADKARRGFDQVLDDIRILD